MTHTIASASCCDVWWSPFAFANASGLCVGTWTSLLPMIGIVANAGDPWPNLRLDLPLLVLKCYEPVHKRVIRSNSRKTVIFFALLGHIHYFWTWTFIQLEDPSLFLNMSWPYPLIILHWMSFMMVDPCQPLGCSKMVQSWRPSDQARQVTSGTCHIA